MNTVPVPGWKFTVYFAVVSCHSVSNHVMHMTGLFCRHLFLLQLRFIGCRRSRFQLPLLRELGLELRVSHYSCTLTRSTPPNRVHFQARSSLFVTDWQFASSCSPRTDFAAAVTFSYRPVDLDLTGTLTPLRRRLRSRTTEPLRGRECDASVEVHARAGQGEPDEPPSGQLAAGFAEGILCAST